MLDYSLITVAVDGVQKWKHFVTCIAYQSGSQHWPGSPLESHFADNLTFFINTSLSGCYCACSHAKRNLLWLLCELNLVTVVQCKHLVQVYVRL